MRDDSFTSFYKAAGFRIFSSASSDWCEMQKGMLISIPFHKIISPLDNELDCLLNDSKCWALRYPTETTNFGFDSYLTFCRVANYSMDTISSKARNQLRKAMKLCTFGEVELSVLCDVGLLLNEKTARRQGRADPKTEREYWHRICQAVASEPRAKVFGSFYDNHLAAYAIVIETATAAEIIIQNSDADLLHVNPNNLLTYGITDKYMNKEHIPVCYGLGSLEDTPNLDHYKIGMGYKFEIIKQRIYFRKSISRILSTFMGKMILSVSRYCLPNHYKVVKGRAILERYRNQN